MMDIRRILALFAVILYSFQPVWAGPTPRLIPQGSVKLVKGGVVVDSEMPVPQGMLMACSGKCMVEAQGLLLVGSDKSVFAIKEEPSDWSILVKKGTINFSLRTDTKPVIFQTPFEGISAQPLIIPTSTNPIIRGTLNVTEDNAVLSLNQGALHVAYAGKESVVRAGENIVLAQAEVGPGGAAEAGAAGGGAGAAAAAGAGAAAAGGGATFLGMGTAALVAAGVGTAAIVGATVVISENTGNKPKKVYEASPF